MSESQYDYTIEKLYEALICLATGKGDVRVRVADACLLMTSLQEKNFPPEHQEEWKWIKDQTTKFGPIRNDKGDLFRGALQNTMKRVRKETGAKIAKKIVSLYWKMSANEPYE